MSFRVFREASETSRICASVSEPAPGISRSITNCGIAALVYTKGAFVVVLPLERESGAVFEFECAPRVSRRCEPDGDSQIAHSRQVSFWKAAAGFFVSQDGVVNRAVEEQI